MVEIGEYGTLILGPNSEIILKKPELGFFETKWGRLIMEVKKNVSQMITEGTLDVTMNQAVAGRKGTIAVFEESQNTSTVKVLEGEIVFKSKAKGDSRNILPGEMISADLDGLSPISTFSVEGELQEWEKIVPKAHIATLRTIINANLTPSTPTQSSGKGIVRLGSSKNPALIWVLSGIILMLLLASILLVLFNHQKNKASIEIKVVMSGGFSQKLPLQLGVNTIGRNPGCTIRIDDAKVSGQHAELRVSEGRYTITDLNSSNGTYVNQEKIHHRKLYQGDRIQIGDTLIEI